MLDSPFILNTQNAKYLIAKYLLNDCLSKLNSLHQVVAAVVLAGAYIFPIGKLKASQGL